MKNIVKNRIVALKANSPIANILLAQIHFFVLVAQPINSSALSKNMKHFYFSTRARVFGAAAKVMTSKHFHINWWT